MSVINIDCLLGFQMFADSSVDAIVCDPPYELGFMGKSWDASGIAYNVDVWREALRVLKPGGHLLAFSGSRTYHRMTCAIEDAGFEVRDQIMWVYGSGFPKSLDVSKAIDKSRAGHAFDEIRDYLRGAIKAAGLTQVQVKAHLGYPADSGIVSHWVANSQPMVPGWADWSAMKAILPLDDRFDSLIQSAEREKIGEKRSGIADAGPPRHTIGGGKSVVVDITAPATDAARQWEGWGTALKPAHEPICVARKPPVGTVAANVLAHGTGAINIDGCRVAAAAGDEPMTWGGAVSLGFGNNATGQYDGKQDQRASASQVGRWPANLIHDGSDEVVTAFPNAKGQQDVAKTDGSPMGNAIYGTMTHDTKYPQPRIELDTSAARFFYCAKASKADRNEGNVHPTVKPTDLMRYLCRLVTPPGGLIIDPFAGSGSTGKAAKLEGFNFVGFELSAEYADIANARIDAVCYDTNNPLN